MFGGERRNRRFIVYLLVVAMSTSSTLPAAAAGEWGNLLKKKLHPHQEVASAEALAAEIDALEKHLDWYGSIVAKQPDVWGQARLMKYRQEFEQTLFAQLDQFKPTLQASISRTDQAYLAQAFSLSAAISGAPATLLPPSQSTSREFFSRQRSALQAGGIAEPTPEQLGATDPLPTIEPSDSNPAADLVSGFDEVIQRTDISLDTGVGFASDASISLEPTVFLDQLARYVNHLHEIRRINEGDDTVDAPGYGLHLVRIPVSILPGTHTRKGFGAEITVTATPYLGRDLLPTTFRNLVINDLVEQVSTPLAFFFNSPTSITGFDEIRKAQMAGIAGITDWYTLRVIDEDEVSQIPEQSEYLVIVVQDEDNLHFRIFEDPTGIPIDFENVTERFPEKSKEIDEIKSLLGNQQDFAQIPAITRSRIVSLVSSIVGRPLTTPPNYNLMRAPILGLPLNANPQGASVVLPPVSGPASPDSTGIPGPELSVPYHPMTPPGLAPDRLHGMSRPSQAPQPILAGFENRPVVPSGPVRNDSVPRRDPSLRRTAFSPFDIQSIRESYLEGFVGSLDRSQSAFDPTGLEMPPPFDGPMPPPAPPVAQRSVDPSQTREERAGDAIAQAAQAISAATAQTVPAARSRNARFAFPGTQFAEVYGMELILPVAFECYDVILRKPLENNDDPTVLPPHRVMSYVQDPITAAYELLSRPEFAHLWVNFATPELARAIQSRDEPTIRRIRGEFLGCLPNGGLQFDRPYGPRYTTTAAFAWAIIAESVLLNERLIRDVHESASAKGAVPIIADGLPFFLPDPPEEARAVFNEYVRTRFPIHVFALDPVNQEQNLADQLSRTREMQLALSLAFVTGNISAGSMTRFARRLELEAQTIALNRTQIAFSHGEDTFGWRFQPRYQTPPTQGNLAAFRDTLFGGPTRDQDRRQLEIEPGARECVALVIMPSFVPYVTFETRANWYKLNSPKHSEIDASKFLALSNSIQRAFTLAEYVCDTGLYRDGDVALLVNRVKQLAAELPMQRMVAQVPYENTSGGFELFNVGVTALAPELLSWYGAPGVSPNNGTSLFLVGDSFSVNQTNVVVGNKLLDSSKDVSLLSRQVMRINVPPGTQQVIYNGRPSVEVSVATPYGVSQSLYVPVFEGPTPPPEPTPPPAPSFHWRTPTLSLAYRFFNLGIIPPPVGDILRERPSRLLIGLDSKVDLGATRADLELRFRKPDDRVPAIKLTDVPYNASLGAFEISGPHFTSLVDQLFSVQRFGSVFGQSSKPRDVVVERTIIRLKGSPQASPVIPQDVADTLTIQWFEAPQVSQPAQPPQSSPVPPGPELFNFPEGREIPVEPQVPERLEEAPGPGGIEDVPGPGGIEDFPGGIEIPGEIKAPGLF